jgi:multidrug efflux system membrane fusion protein
MSTQSGIAPVSEVERSNTAHKRSHAWIWLVVLVCIVAVAGYFLFERIRAGAQSQATTRPDSAGRAPPVVAAIAILGDVPVYKEGLGQVTPLNTVTIHTRVDGQLVKVAFIEGQMVHTGDLLAQIDPGPYQAAVEQAQGALVRDQAMLDNAKVDLKRYTDAPTAYTQQQIDTQKALVEQDDGLVKSDQGNLDSAKVQLDYCTITSPLDGRIGLRQVDQGNIVHASDVNGLAVITQLQPITVIFHLPEDDIPLIINKSNLPVEAWDRDRSVKLATGKLTALDSQVDPTSASVSLKAEFPNTDNLLFPSQFVNARILVDTERNKVIVPAAAVQQGPDSAFVYVVGADTSVEVRPITIGETVGDTDQAIETGLSVGETVVTDGVDKLQPGLKVTVRQIISSGSSSTTRASTRPGGRGRRGGGRNGAASAASQSSAHSGQVGTDP